MVLLRLLQVSLRTRRGADFTAAVPVPPAEAGLRCRSAAPPAQVSKL